VAPTTGNNLTGDLSNSRATSNDEAESASVNKTDQHVDHAPVDDDMPELESDSDWETDSDTDLDSDSDDGNKDQCMLSWTTFGCYAYFDP
jgi:hypothetical protein